MVQLRNAFGLVPLQLLWFSMKSIGLPDEMSIMRDPLSKFKQVMPRQKRSLRDGVSSKAVP